MLMNVLSFFKPDGEACWKAGIVLDERADAGVKTENEKETIVTEARRFYKKGCDLNFARACIQIYLVEGVPERLQKRKALLIMIKRLIF